MMHRLRRYDVFRFAQNDVARSTRNDAMFAQCAVRHTSFAQRTSLGVANIILNKMDELDGTNERLLKYYRENIEKHRKL